MWGWKTSVLLSVKHHTCQLRENVFGHKSTFRIQRRKLCPAHCLLPSENRNRRSGKPNVFGIFTPDFQTNLSLFSTLLNGEYLDALMENVRQQISFLYSCFPAMLGDVAVTMANYRWTIKRSCFQMKYQSVQNLLRSMYHEKMRKKNMIFIQNTLLFKRIMTICHVILKVESSC